MKLLKIAEWTADEYQRDAKIFYLVLSEVPEGTMSRTQGGNTMEFFHREISFDSIYGDAYIDIFFNTKTVQFAIQMYFDNEYFDQEYQETRMVDISDKATTKANVLKTIEEMMQRKMRRK